MPSNDHERLLYWHTILIAHDSSFWKSFFRVYHWACGAHSHKVIIKWVFFLLTLCQWKCRKFAVCCTHSFWLSMTMRESLEASDLYHRTLTTVPVRSSIKTASACIVQIVCVTMNQGSGDPNYLYFVCNLDGCQLCLSSPVLCLKTLMNVKAPLAAMVTVHVTTHLAHTTASAMLVSMETEKTAQTWTSASPSWTHVMKTLTALTLLDHIVVNVSMATQEMESNAMT